MAVRNCKYSDWLQEYTFDNCKLNRKEYGEFLSNYIKGENDGFVLNLNGAWGTGKTEFLRRLYTHLTNEGHPTIYIDAWESDFSEVPLSVVASELINQLSIINHNIGSDLDKLKGFLGKALKGAVIAGAGLATKYLVDDSAAGREVVKILFETSPKDFLTSVKKDHEEQVEAIKSIRKELGLLAEVLKQTHGKELPVIVLIDELDRCRPNYAIEMLEVIKHFFTTKNFVFVVATDTTQLQESIKSVYGFNFDSNTYLKRFFNREARLAEPDHKHYLNLHDFSFSEYAGKVDMYPVIENTLNVTIAKYVEWMAKVYDLSLRDIDQLIDKFKACLRTALVANRTNGEVQVVNVFSLLIALIEFDKGYKQFLERALNNPATEGQFTTDLIVSTEWGKPTKFSELYSLNMKNSVLHYRYEKNDYNRKTKLLLPGTHILVNESGQNYSDSTMQKTFSETENILKKGVEVTTSRLWLWEDYQKVVRLAGHLD
ncbi:MULTISPECIES: P-loop NTPase fold protein [unclassified Pseudoalteromonas]|uniref:KAP family P-loop NTPase fold protein n=1 Tax=unclassified Pseudoalteromonas TaxID=194690 RepID=UPI0013FE1E4D|nr:MULTISPECIES: P-loop NTPase fold protein [unclassified Pseudoalteromonas]